MVSIWPFFLWWFLISLYYNYALYCKCWDPILTSGLFTLDRVFPRLTVTSVLYRNENCNNKSISCYNKSLKDERKWITPHLNVKTGYYINIPLHNLSAYHLNDDLHYMCIILENVKRSPNPHVCSNFQENKIFKTYACNCLITSPEQFIVMFYQLFGNGHTMYQMWLAFTKVPKCLTKFLKDSLQLGNPSFLKEILLHACRFCIVCKLKSLWASLPKNYTPKYFYGKKSHEKVTQSRK